MSVHAVLEEKRMLEKQIDAVQQEIRALPDVNAKEEGLQRDKRELVYRRDTPRWEQVSGPFSLYDLRVLEASIQTKEAELKILKSNKSELSNRLAQLEQQFGQLDLSFTAEEVAEVQAEWMKLEERLKALQGALSAIEKEEKLSEKTLSELTSLKVKHEDLLADIALGIDGAAEEIKAIGGLLPELQEQYEAEKAKELEQEKAAAGLRRKIEGVKDLLPTAKGNYRVALAQFVQNEIDQAGCEYVELAQQFSQSFLRVVALASICDDLGKTIRVFGPRTAQFNIPAFRIKPCMEFINTQIFDFSTADITPALEAEADRLGQQGLMLPT